MRAQFQFSFKPFAVFCVLIAAASTAHADAVYSSFPTNAIMTPGLSFVTEMRVVTTSNSLGAFSVLVQYDPRVIQIQSVALPLGSPFIGNAFADGSSYQSGETRIVGFRTTNSVPHPEGETAFYVVWRAVGTTVRKTAITNVVESNVDSNWRATEVWQASSTARLDETDTDGDGLPDWWERLYFGGPTSAVANEDSDGDGFTNLDEYLGGTSPRDAVSVLMVTRLEIVGMNVVISFPTVLGRTYLVEQTDNLATTGWASVGESIAGTGDTASVVDTNAVLLKPQFFYRVQVSPE